MTATPGRLTASAGGRPVAHLTPPTGWLSDPNGLFVLDGRFHACYQHHPFDDDWGPMHWGHASSADLVNWVHHGVALSPDATGMAFSGSAHVDHEGDAGCGAGAVLAAYTAHSDDEEVQCIAVSMDGGDTWSVDDFGRVLAHHPPRKDFRDPRLLRWRADDGSECWLMLTAGGPEVEFYVSDDLRTWTLAGRFGQADPGAVWETPELIQLDDPADGGRCWMLTVGVLTDGPESTTHTDAFLGTFDGTRFVPFEDRPARVDAGPDFYAAQAWVQHHQPIWTAWVGNWATARTVESTGWRGVLALPRTISLSVDSAGRRRLRQRPAPTVLDRIEPVPGVPETLVVEEGVAVVATCAVTVDVRFTASVRRGAAAEMVLRDRETDRAVLRWDRGVATLALTLADGCCASRRFESAPHADVDLLDLRIVVDHRTLEVFAHHGEIVFTALLDPLDADAVLLARVVGTAPIAVSNLTARRLPTS